MKELSTLLVIQIAVIFFQIVNFSFYLGWFCHEKKLVVTWVIFIGLLRFLGSLSYLERSSLLEEYGKLPCGFLKYFLNFIIYLYIFYPFGIYFGEKCGSSLIFSQMATHFCNTS